MATENHGTIRSYAGRLPSAICTRCGSLRVQNGTMIDHAKGDHAAIGGPWIFLHFRCSIGALDQSSLSSSWSSKSPNQRISRQRACFHPAPTNEAGNQPPVPCTGLPSEPSRFSPRPVVVDGRVRLSQRAGRRLRPLMAAPEHPKSYIWEEEVAPEGSRLNIHLADDRFFK